MQIFDITQELFSGVVFPGDPKPLKNRVLSISKGDTCNLTEFSACAHNATHLDAPCHFVDHGRSVAEMDLSKCLGQATVIHCDDVLSVNEVREVVRKGCKRLLINGQGVITLESARVMVESGIVLIGVEPQTVGAGDEIVPIHQLLLGNEVVIVEGLVLEQVPEGDYMLSALPLKMSGSDGSPVRAVLYRE